MPPCPAPDTCWLYLIRHGATANNRARPPRLQGRRTDPGLSDEGCQQARLTADALADLPLGTVYTSPLLRARETAEAIARPHGLPIEIVEDLIEVDVGQWEGRTWEEIQRTDPEAYRLFAADAGVHPYLGGENFGSLQARVVPALGRLMAQNLGRVVAVVGHNCVNRVCLAHLLEMPLAKYRLIPQDNCGVNLLRCRDGQAKLVTINATGHLEAG
jgi:broad specificity phosphatase PhoE